MQIKFSDSAGTTLTALAVNGQRTYFQGANRDSLEIQFAKDAVAFDVLDKLTANQANLKELTQTDGEKQSVLDNYSLRTGLSLKPVVIASATSTTPEQTEDRLCLSLAQKTYLEMQVEQQTAAFAALGQQVTALTLQSVKGGAVS